ncbi:MAG TPA: MMPL family transporter [Candidatus Angelobacter sp.]|nr:MMPL family transporter [Candidatus Angelobacter sp.]
MSAASTRPRPQQPDDAWANGVKGAAARAGRWSAQHRKTAIWGWLAFVVIAFMIGNAVGTKTLQSDQLAVGESGRADRAIVGAFQRSAEELVLIQSPTAQATDPSFRAAVADVQRRLQKVPYARDIESPYAAANSGQISADRRSALIRFKIAGDDTEAEDRVGAALEAVSAAQAAHPGFTIAESGDASVTKQLDASISEDFKRALFTSLPVTLVILLIAFGALVAAGVPLLLALTAVMATIGLMGPISHIGGVDTSVNEVILLIGLAVGVDYSMFYLRREREERESGRSESASLAAAAATSGRAVMVSGFTVMIAMAGMYLAGASTFESFATGTILVVAVAVVGSLTVLPATLAWLGDRVEKGGVPIIKDQPWNAGESTVWSRILNPVLRHPVVSILATGGLLVVLAIPAFSLHTADPGTDSLPQDLSVIKAYNRMQDAFPGGPIPAIVAVSAADVTSPEVRDGIAKLENRAASSPHFKQPVTIEISSDRTVAQVSLPLAGDGSNSQSTTALAALRDRVIPETVGAVPGVTADVTGFTADSVDFTAALKSHAPIVFGFVLVAAFILLLFTFRSIVIPLKAIVLNLLSVGAAYGILVWIFQQGHLESVLDFKSPGAIVSWMPIFLFVVLFGLSMDYHVFILTRIREAFDRGRPTEDAVAHGIKSTAGVVTSAAVVMISVFAVFATLSLVIFKELGVGLAVAVLIDATLIRGVLLPATMQLLGDWNWYLPRWLQWLPHVGPGDASGLPPAPLQRPTPVEEGKPEAVSG